MRETPFSLGGPKQEVSVSRFVRSFRFSRSGSFTMDAFTNMLDPESRISAARIVGRLSSHWDCVRPKIVEVAIQSTGFAYCRANN